MQLRASGHPLQRGWILRDGNGDNLDSEFRVGDGDRTGDRIERESLGDKEAVRSVGTDGVDDVSDPQLGMYR